MCLTSLVTTSIYLILSLLDDAVPIRAQEESMTYSFTPATKQRHYVSNSAHTMMPSRRAEEVQLGDELAICTPQGACQPCAKEDVRSQCCVNSPALVDDTLVFIATRAILSTLRKPPPSSLHAIFKQCHC